VVPLTADGPPNGGGGGGGGGGGEGRRTVKRYGARVIVVHWLFVLTFIPLVFTGCLLLRDWWAAEFHVYGIDPVLPTFDGASTLHAYLGAVVLVIGLSHVLLHIRQRERPILPRKVGQDLGASIHNILYIFHLVARQERGAGEKYRGNQRMTYIALAYCLSLSGLTALVVRLDVAGGLAVLMHVCAGILILALSAYRILTLIRKHDAVATRCILATGRMPVWYVRKNHFLWYRQLRGGYDAPPEPHYEGYATDTEDKPEVMKA
jgi:cytochrome b561